MEFGQIKFREIEFLVVLNIFPVQKNDFWPFLKLQKMEFDQKFFREIDLFDFTSLDFFNFLAHCGFIATIICENSDQSL